MMHKLCDLCQDAQATSDLSSALLAALTSGADLTYAGNLPLHTAADRGHLACVEMLAAIYPDPDAWFTFLMGGAALGEVREYRRYEQDRVTGAAPLNNRARNYLPLLYGNPDVIRTIWSFVHKPRYVDIDQLNGDGCTALQLAEANDHTKVIDLLISLGGKASSLCPLVLLAESVGVIITSTMAFFLWWMVNLDQYMLQLLASLLDGMTPFVVNVAVAGTISLSLIFTVSVSFRLRSLQTAMSRWSIAITGYMFATTVFIYCASHEINRRRELYIKHKNGVSM